MTSGLVAMKVVSALPKRGALPAVTATAIIRHVVRLSGTVNDTFAPPLASVWRDPLKYAS